MRRLLVILLFGFILRTIFLGIVPPGFNADEAALGYNAYSILKTGKDEWGESFPLVFKSFSDYKPGLYVYLAVPFIAVLGLNEFAVRLPSIILGLFSIYFIYLLSKEIFKKEIVSLSSAFLLAISPWHIHYSRGAWETNIATFFILVGVWAFLKGLQKSNFFYLSAISFLGAMYSYQSPRLIIPLLALLLVTAFWREIFLREKNNRFSINKGLIGPMIVSVLFIIPLIFIMTSNKGLARFQGVSIFTDTGSSVRVDQKRGEHDNSNDLASKLYHNRLIAFGLDFTTHYLDHFDPQFLFISGDPLGRNKIPDMGQMYLFEIVTLLVGVYFIIKTNTPYSKVIFLWLLIAPIASSLTYQTPHALRAANMVVPLVLISGTGLGFLLESLLRLKLLYRSVFFSGLIIVLIFFISNFFDQYFIHLPKTYALEWEYGFSQMATYVLENKDKYKKVLITDQYDQPYILMLFYSKYDPISYYQSARPTGVDKFGFSTVRSFDKFEFRPIGQDEVGKDEDTLYVGTQLEIGDRDALKIINFPNGEVAFKIVGSK